MTSPRFRYIVLLVAFSDEGWPVVVFTGLNTRSLFGANDHDDGDDGDDDGDDDDDLG